MRLEDEALLGSSAAAAVDIDGVRHAYGDTPVLRRIDLSLAPGEVLALLGPSGCGKTTLLRLIAGLLAPVAGRIAIGGRVVACARSGVFVPPEGRGLGMVFQDYALWPHLSVGRNVTFPLEMRGVPRAEREARATAALARVGLEGFGTRQPGALSGGQQQRVAIARAVVAEPRLVLFDEPLSNLDRDLRDQLAGEIASLLRGLGLSGVYVTHDQAEAFTLADRVAVMQQGAIVQLDPPERLVEAPAAPAVAEFLHLGTIARGARRGGDLVLPAADAALPLAGSSLDADLPEGWTGRVLLARRALSIAPEGALRGRVVRSLFRGDHHLLTVRIGAAAAGLDVTVAAARRAAPGDEVGLHLDAAKIRVFPDRPSDHSRQETKS